MKSLKTTNKSDRKTEENYVKICPHCGSTKIKMPPAGLDIKMTIRDYCQKCKKHGNFPEIETSKIKLFRKKLK